MSIIQIYIMNFKGCYQLGKLRIINYSKPTSLTQNHKRRTYNKSKHHATKSVYNWPYRPLYNTTIFDKFQHKSDERQLFRYEMQIFSFTQSFVNNFKPSKTKRTLTKIIKVLNMLYLSPPQRNNRLNSRSRRCVCRGYGMSIDFARCCGCAVT